MGCVLNGLTLVPIAWTIGTIDGGQRFFFPSDVVCISFPFLEDPSLLPVELSLGPKLAPRTPLLQHCLFLLSCEGVDLGVQRGSERVLCCLADRLHAQLAEDSADRRWPHPRELFSLKVWYTSIYIYKSIGSWSFPPSKCIKTCYIIRLNQNGHIKIAI